LGIAVIAVILGYLTITSAAGPTARDLRLSKLLLPSDRNNLVHQQNGYHRECDPCGQSIAPEKVEGPAYTAGACRDPTADAERCSGREVRTLNMPEAKEFAHSPYDDNGFNRDSDLSPTLFGHAEDSIVRHHLTKSCNYSHLP